MIGGCPNLRIGVVLGSGLGAAAFPLADQIVVPYAEIPHFPHATIKGHKGRLVVGFLGERAGHRDAGAGAFL
jgi:purine nucleoside phosphorylase